VLDLSLPKYRGSYGTLMIENSKNTVTVGSLDERRIDKQMVVGSNSLVLIEYLGLA